MRVIGDTGWVTAGTAPSGVGWANPIQYRLLGGVVYWRGLVNASLSANAWKPIATGIPQEAWPTQGGAPLAIAPSSQIQASGGVYVSSQDIEIVSSTTGADGFRISGSYPSLLYPPDVTVLQLNIWMQVSKAGSVAGLAAIIKAVGADVVLLAESDAATTQALRTALGGEWFAAASPDTGILSRFPIASSRSAVDGRWTNAVLGVCPRPISVYATHLEYRWYAPYLPRGYGSGAPSGPYAGWGKLASGPVTSLSEISAVNVASGRPAMMQTLLDNAAADRRQGRMVLIGGDFNEASHEDWTTGTASTFARHGVAYPWDTTSMLAQAGWHDGYRAQHPDPATHPGITWPSDNPAVAVSAIDAPTDTDVRDRIDFVFHHPQDAWTLTSATLVGPTGTIANGARQPQAGADPYTPFTGVWPSDHKANLQKFSLSR